MREKSTFFPYSVEKKGPQVRNCLNPIYLFFDRLNKLPNGILACDLRLEKLLLLTRTISDHHRKITSAKYFISSFNIEIIAFLGVLNVQISTNHSIDL